jgi:hypothetical protein
MPFVTTLKRYPAAHCTYALLHPGNSVRLKRTDYLLLERSRRYINDSIDHRLPFDMRRGNISLDDVKWIA